MNQFFNDLPAHKTPPRQSPDATQKTSSELYSRYEDGAVSGITSARPSSAPRPSAPQTPTPHSNGAHHTGMTGIFTNVPTSQAHASGVQVPRPAPAPQSVVRQDMTTPNNTQAPVVNAPVFKAALPDAATPSSVQATQVPAQQMPTPQVSSASMQGGQYGQGVQGGAQSNHGLQGGSQVAEGVGVAEAGPMGPTTGPTPHPTATSDGVQNYSATPVPNILSTVVPSAIVPPVPAVNAGTAAIIPDDAAVPADIVDEMFETEDVDNAAQISSDQASNIQYIPMHAGRSRARQRFSFLLKIILLLLAAGVICVGLFASNLMPRTSWYNDFARLTQFLPFD
ncbi:MAG: hypothetical protein LBC50_00020 [Candidatus Ancillula sp.]|jgi:hypothetical protein|nr:hypothetical protein [Candidatus Ancillula sp.]